MKILPIKTEYSYNKPSHFSKPVFGSSGGDVFVKSKENSFPFKAITSKTAELLYGIDYTPVSEPIEGYYMAYALDKKTLKPVDIYIKKTFSDPTSEDVVKYYFYRKKPDGGLKLVGTRNFTFNDELQKIMPGCMESLDDTIIGVGHLEQQIAFEEMLKRGYKNIQIEAVQDAYDFHKKCGFKSIDYYVYRTDRMLDDSAYYWAKRLNEKDVRKIRELFVFKPDSEVPMLNHNKTMENIVLYMKKTGKQIADDIKVYMELSELAKGDWEIIARKNRILKIGKI